MEYMSHHNNEINPDDSNFSFSVEDETRKNELIKRLTFELDRDEAEPGSGRSRETIFQELNQVLGLIPKDDKSEELDVTDIPKGPLTDADLEDMGGRRCACGEPVFQLGVPNEQHCELDTK